MSWIEGIIDKAEDLAKSDEEKEALKVLKKHRKGLQAIGEENAKKFLAYIGLGKNQDAKSYLMILDETPEELIAGVERSADEFRELHEGAVAAAEKLEAEMAEFIGDVGRIALSFLVAAL